MSGHTPWREIRDKYKGQHPRYQVTAERDGKGWFLRPTGVPGVFSRASRLDQAEAMARDAIALALEIEPDSFDVDIHPLLPGIDELVITTQQLRAAAATLTEGANLHLVKAVHRLVDEEQMTLRDIASLLKISFQRVAQLRKQHRPLADFEDAHLTSVYDVLGKELDRRVQIHRRSGPAPRVVTERVVEGR